MIATEQKTIYVKWVDSSEAIGWNKIEDCTLLEPLVVETIGFLLYENDKVLVVTGHVSDDGDACGAMTIPKVSILKQVECLLQPEPPF